MTKLLNGCVQLPRDTAANWQSMNETIPQGVECYEIDSGRTKIGDGVNDWDNLKYTNENENYVQNVLVNNVPMPRRKNIIFSGPTVLGRDVASQDAIIIEILTDSQVLGVPTIDNDAASLSKTIGENLTLTISDIDMNAVSIEWSVSGSPDVIAGELNNTLNNSITFSWSSPGTYTVSVRAVGNGISFTNSQWATVSVTISASSGNDSGTVLLIHFDGANGSSNIQDDSLAGNGGLKHTVTNSGVSLVSLNRLIESTSGHFNGSSFLRIDSSADFYFNRNKCVECWIRPSNDGTIISQWISGGGYHRNFSISVVGGKIVVYHNRDGVNYILYGISDVMNKKTHVAFSFNYATKLGKLFINGIAEDSIPMNGSGTASADNPLYIGVYNESEGVYYSGLIDELRISNNLRYDTNFTPPNYMFI